MKQKKEENSNVVQLVLVSMFTIKLIMHMYNVTVALVAVESVQQNRRDNVIK